MEVTRNDPKICYAILFVMTIEPKRENVDADVSLVSSTEHTRAHTLGPFSLGSGGSWRVVEGSGGPKS